MSEDEVSVVLTNLSVLGTRLRDRIGRREVKRLEAVITLLSDEIRRRAVSRPRVVEIDVHAPLEQHLEIVRRHVLQRFPTDVPASLAWLELKVRSVAFVHVESQLVLGLTG